MANTIIRRGVLSLRGTYTGRINYSGFSGTPVVTVTVSDTFKNGALAYLRDITATGATVVAYYNGGTELTDCNVQWIAIGPTNRSDICAHHHSAHRCYVEVYGSQ